MVKNQDSENELFTCADCGDEYPSDEIENINDLDYCEDCASENFGYCGKCEEREDNDSLYYSESFGDCLCESCKEELIVSCYNCRDEIYIHNDNVCCSDDGDYFCSSDCYCDHYFCCDECGCEYPNDEMACNDDGCYCEECGGEINGYCNGSSKAQYTEEKKLFDTNGYTIGIELETIKPNDLSYSGEYAGWFKENIKGKYDGSLSSAGIEFITPPINNDNVLHFTRKLSNTLIKSGFTIDESCGYHLHIGGEKLVSAKNRHKIMMVSHIFKDAIKSMTPPSRWKNNYCGFDRINVNAELTKKEAVDNPEKFYRQKTDRYNFINFDSVRKFGTIEIRCHQGTINAEKILNWIRIWIKLFDYAINNKYNKLFCLRGTKREFRQKILKDNKLIGYYNDRIKKFGYKYDQRKKSFKTIIADDKTVEELTEESRIEYFDDKRFIKRTYKPKLHPNQIHDEFKRLFNQKKLEQIKHKLDWESKKVKIEEYN